MGKNYSYEYDRESENDTSCGDLNQSVIISAPVTKYIKKNSVTSYVVTINEINSENLINKYEFDKTKIKLVGETDAIYNVSYENKEPDCEMKTVYSVVGKKNNTKDANVEKAIRDSIEMVWEKTALDILEKYYPYQVSKDHGAPTNMEFVKNMARKMRNHLI